MQYGLMCIYIPVCTGDRGERSRRVLALMFDRIWFDPLLCQRTRSHGGVRCRPRSRGATQPCRVQQSRVRRIRHRPRMHHPFRLGHRAAIHRRYRLIRVMPRSRRRTHDFVHDATEIDIIPVRERVHESGTFVGGWPDVLSERRTGPGPP